MLAPEVLMSSHPHRSRAAGVVAPRSAPALPLVPFAAAVTALVMLLSLGAARAQDLGPARAYEAPGDRVVVSGQGVVYGEPDQAVLELGVEATDADARAVIEATSEAMRELQEALVAQGVREDDIRTTIFDLYREEPLDGGGEPLPERYRLIHMVEVTVREVSAVGDILAEAVDAGADRIGGVRFGLSDPGALQEQARRAAVQDARSKAETLSEAAGRTLGEALRIEETDGAEPPRPFESRTMSLAAADAAPVAPGRLAVRVNVTVAYALE